MLESFPALSTFYIMSDIFEGKKEAFFKLNHVFEFVLTAWNCPALTLLLFLFVEKLQYSFYLQFM